MTHTGRDGLRDCSTCGDQRSFDPLVCPDGHGSECPEFACRECGEAVFVGIFEFDAIDEAVESHAAAA